MQGLESHQETLPVLNMSTRCFAFMKVPVGVYVHLWAFADLDNNGKREKNGCVRP